MCVCVWVCNSLVLFAFGLFVCHIFLPSNIRRGKKYGKDGKFPWRRSEFSFPSVCKKNTRNWIKIWIESFFVLILVQNENLKIHVYSNGENFQIHTHFPGLFSVKSSKFKFFNEFHYKYIWSSIESVELWIIQSVTL